MDAATVRLGRLLASLVADGAPEARLVVPPPPGTETGAIGLLPGSFNPPTQAHVALARAGRAAGLATVVYVLAKRTVNKERVTGLQLADRLSLLEQIARPDGDAVAVVNRGLYVDQALAMRSALPNARELDFLVGHDKILQIFDPRYYDDRDAALEHLFATASFLVAPRAGADDADLRELMARPENARFAGRVRHVDLPAQYLEMSSTRVREGDLSDVPPPVGAFIAEWRPYAPDGPYTARAAELERSS